MDVVAYFVVGPSFWNDLPVDLRFEDDLTCFESSLKTHLFTLFTKNSDSYIYWYVIFDLYICGDIGHLLSLILWAFEHI